MTTLEFLISTSVATSLRKPVMRRPMQRARCRLATKWPRVAQHNALHRVGR
jgi:hypothetical protein